MNDTATLQNFRKETSGWLEENCPPGAPGPGEIPWGSTKLGTGDADTTRWLEVMVEKGWTVPTWPREYGGAGLTKQEFMVLQEEIRRIGARAPLTGRGINYIGPTILEFGTPQQKEKWLPRLARGDGGWCMGYSEPAAGSDLANLQMRAVDQGDFYLLNGMKTWTSDGINGDWIFCLVRTDPKAPKHEGISLILVGMHQSGVRVQPISLISGSSPFCETFFEDATAEKEDLIGGVNHGWSVGKRLLQYERSIHAGVNTSGIQRQDQEASLVDIVREYHGADASGRISDPWVRDRLLRLEMESRGYQLTQRRVMAETQARAPSTATSILKVTGAHLTKERTELHQQALGGQGLGWEGDGFSARELQATKTWLSSRAVSIYGGTSEIQLNIIAKRVLGLPD
jgi:alkylation response protein AidB-like acyl-CoA dehydrogenase